MEAAISGFELLDVWKEARLFRIMIIDLCKKIPREENFRLIDQIKRSSRSVTANISEGYGRFHYLDNIKFCRDARASLNETFDHITVVFDEKYIVFRFTLSLLVATVQGKFPPFEIVVRTLVGSG